jgi:hypothetical protein
LRTFRIRPHAIRIPVQQKQPIPVVHKVDAETSHAIMALDSNIRPDYLVMLKPQANA